MVPQLPSDDKVIPRCVWQVSSSIITLLNTTLGQFGFLFLVINNDLVLFGFKVMHQLFAH